MFDIMKIEKSDKVCGDDSMVMMNSHFSKDLIMNDGKSDQLCGDYSISIRYSTKPM